MSAHTPNNSTNEYLDLYWGDQSKLYSGVFNPHFKHDVQGVDSKAQIGRIWKVFWILLVVTAVEVIVGMFFGHSLPKPIIITFFLALTIVKAAYIVDVFMHLGDEKKFFRWLVLGPLGLFFWMITAFLMEGNYWLDINTWNIVR